MAYCAITTKFIGPTDARVSRVKATAGFPERSTGKPRTYTAEWQHNLDGPENHKYAAQKLATQLGWDGMWIMGETVDQYVFVRMSAHGSLADTAFVVQGE